MLLQFHTMPARSWLPGIRMKWVLYLGIGIAVAILASLSGRLVAQIEGERGIAPVARETDIEVNDIKVDVTGRNGEEARANGWKEAQRLAWKKIGGGAASDGQLSAMVSAIVIKQEQISAHRYIATLEVIFNRGKVGEFAFTNASDMSRSAPVLVLPILESGGVAQVFEVRNVWQRAWANFQVAASPIDYIRPVGAGSDSLLLTAGQAGRHSRRWWRTALNQFGASDVLIPIAKLQHEYPGGPVHGTFTARYGPDNTWLDSFTLTAPNDSGVPDMLNQALVRLDLIYRDALARGVLRPDPGLAGDSPRFNAIMAKLRAQMPPEIVVPRAQSAEEDVMPAEVIVNKPATQTITVQFETPDAVSLDATLSAIRSVSGVQEAATSSIAMGGVSVMRVTMSGNAEALATALRSRGLNAAVTNGVLIIRR